MNPPASWPAGPAPQGGAAAAGHLRRLGRALQLHQLLHQQVQRGAAGDGGDGPHGAAGEDRQGGELPLGQLLRRARAGHVQGPVLSGVCHGQGR